MTQSSSLVPIDHDRLLQTFLTLLNVDSYHGDENRVVAVIRPILEPLGITFRQDAIGNLIGLWPGQGKDGPPIMLNAHMDTVRPTPDMQPVVEDDGVHSDGSSVLGADDKAGLAAIIEAVLAVHDARLDHVPVDLVFTVGEDVGHIGSKAFDPADVASRRAFVLDAGGRVGNIIVRAPGQRRFTATLRGRAAHAGLEPELGISAIRVLARAIDRMPLGRVDAETTANIGRVEGGMAHNIVAPEATLQAEARSLSEARLQEQVGQMRAAIEDAAAAYGAEAEIDERKFYTAYALQDDDPALQLADQAIRASGIDPQHVSTGGGSDAHEFNEMGITSVCLSMGYVDVHTVKEFMPHDQLRAIAQVSCQLIRLA